jgi:hypothetical protein
MIQDVDQLLERLVRRDALNGSAVDLQFDAPTKDWVARRSGPCVDLYLYDIREDLARRVPTWEDMRGPDGIVTGRVQPHRRFRLAYLVTAWTQRPEDEHRLLSSLLLCFLRNAMLKPGELGGALDAADLPLYIDVGQPAPEERSLADVWTALGGELKPSLDVVVTAPIVVAQVAGVGAAVRETPTFVVSQHGVTDPAEAAAKQAGKQAAKQSTASAEDGDPMERILERIGPRGSRNAAVLRAGSTAPDDATGGQGRAKRP